MAKVMDVTDERVVGSSSGNGSMDELHPAVKLHKRYNFTTLYTMFVVVGASVSSPSLEAM